MFYMHYPLLNADLQPYIPIIYMVYWVKRLPVSRDDMFFYNGREEGEVIGAIRTYKRMGVTLENARCYIMDAYV